LGGRYGSVESESQKSYTQLEYEYAIEKGIPLFAVFLTETALANKENEKLNEEKLQNFRELVLSKICKPVDDCKDIKIAISQTIAKFEKEYEFIGWISGKGIKNQFKDVRILKPLNNDLPEQLLIQNNRGQAINPTIQWDGDNGMVVGFKELVVTFGDKHGIFKMGLHGHGIYIFQVTLGGYGYDLGVQIPNDFCNEAGYINEDSLIQASTYDFSGKGKDNIILAFYNCRMCLGYTLIFSVVEIGATNKINPFVIEIKHDFQQHLIMNDNELRIPYGSQGAYDSYFWFEDNFYQSAK
jgi:hypothetical protein